VEQGSFSFFQIDMLISLGVPTNSTECTNACYIMLFVSVAQSHIVSLLTASEQGPMTWLVALGSADQLRMSCVVRDKTVHIMLHTQHTRLDIPTETCLKVVGSCSPSEI
jgi:hypothetical protein